MSKKLFKSNLEPSCQYCRWSCALLGHDSLWACEHLGVVAEEDDCRKFVYDPIKRRPKAAPKLPRFDEKDFEL